MSYVFRGENFFFELKKNLRYENKENESHRTVTARSLRVRKDVRLTGKLRRGSALRQRRGRPAASFRLGNAAGPASGGLRDGGRFQHWVCCLFSCTRMSEGDSCKTTSTVLIFFSFLFLMFWTLASVPQFEFRVRYLQPS